MRQPRARGAAVLVLAAAAGSGLLTAALSEAPDVPAALARLPADPSPQKLLAPGHVAWAFMERIDPEGGWLTATEEGGGRLDVRLLPYAVLKRFGEPGADPADFPAGERVRLTLAATAGPHAGRYALELCDEVTAQLQEGTAFRLTRQDAERYEFEAEPIDASSGRKRGPTIRLRYGPDTVVMNGAAPLFTFRLRPGETRRITTGADARGGRMARWVLDEPALARFRATQRSRALARGRVLGARARLDPNGRTARVMPNDAVWIEEVAETNTVRVQLERAPESRHAIRSAPARPGWPGPIVALDPPLSARAAPTDIRLQPAGQAVDFARHVRPLLEANCGACHGGVQAQSGYSIETAERVKAGGRRGAAVVPGSADTSLLYRLMSGERNPRMPPDREPSPHELTLLRRWIEGGTGG